MTAINLQSLAQLTAERILNCTAEGMVIALLAWLLLRAIGRQNSGTRFAVWFAALLVTAASTSDGDDLGDLAALAGVRDYSGRVKCATLPWHALRAAIEGS